MGRRELGRMVLARKELVERTLQAHMEALEDSIVQMGTVNNFEEEVDKAGESVDIGLKRNCNLRIQGNSRDCNSGNRNFDRLRRHKCLG